MAVTTSTVSVSMRVTETSAQALGSASYSPTLALTAILAAGTGDNQADRYYEATTTLAASASGNIDLAGSLTDAFGAALTFVKIRAILVTALAANTNDVLVGGVGTNAFIGPFGSNSQTQAVKPGGWWFVFAPKTGWTVTAGTADLLKVANGGAGTSVTYTITILGCSA